MPASLGEVGGVGSRDCRLDFSSGSYINNNKFSHCCPSPDEAMNRCASLQHGHEGKLWSSKMGVFGLCSSSTG